MFKKNMYLKKPYKKRAENIFSKKYSDKYRQNILSKTRQKVFSRQVRLYAEGKKATVQGRFIEFLKQAKKQMKEKGKTPDNIPILFIENIREMISVLPKGDYFKNKLIEEIRKDSSYELSPDKSEFIFRDLYFGPARKIGKKSAGFIVFLGKNIPEKHLVKQLKRMAKMLVDPEYRIKLESKIADKTEISAVFYPKIKK